MDLAGKLIRALRSGCKHLVTDISMPMLPRCSIAAFDHAVVGPGVAAAVHTPCVVPIFPSLPVICKQTCNQRPQPGNDAPLLQNNSVGKCGPTGSGAGVFHGPIFSQWGGCPARKRYHWNGLAVNLDTAPFAEISSNGSTPHACSFTRTMSASYLLRARVVGLHPGQNGVERTLATAGGRRVQSGAACAVGPVARGKHQFLHLGSEKKRETKREIETY